MANDARPRPDWMPPENATHWKAQKRNVEIGQWQTQQLIDSISAPGAGGVVTEMKRTMFEISSWPHTLPDIQNLLQSRWGFGEFKVRFFIKGDDGTKQASTPVEFNISAPAAPPAIPPQNGAQNGAYPPPQAMPAAMGPAAMMGTAASMLGQRGLPPGFGQADPMTQAMMCVQMMFTWQQETQASIREREERRSAEERREREERSSREMREREQAYERELQRTREHYREVERIRAEGERAARARDENHSDELEELKNELKELREDKSKSKVGNTIADIASALKEIAPIAKPVVEKIVDGVIKAREAQQVAQVASNIVGSGTGGGT